MKFLRIEKSLTSVENVVLTITNRREGATLLSVDECHSIEVRASDLRGLIGFDIGFEAQIAREDYQAEDQITPGTLQGL